MRVRQDIAVIPEPAAIITCAAEGDMEAWHAEGRGCLGNRSTRRHVIKRIDHDSAAAKERWRIRRRQLDMLRLDACAGGAIKHVGQHTHLGRAHVLLRPRLRREVMHFDAVAVDHP